MQDFNWDDLLDDIEEQNAVLLLGHGFLPGTQAALGEQLREKLQAKLLYSYAREGLFLFADSEAKTTAQKEAARHYRGFQADAEILKKMVEMPFPLMISANPDKLLLNAFAQYRLPCQFDYFSSQYKATSSRCSAGCWPISMSPPNCARPCARPEYHFCRPRFAGIFSSVV